MSSASVEADLGILRRIAVRDETALAELFDRHSKLAYSVIMRIVRNSPDAEEVLQETFVRVWTRADTYDPRLGAPVAWLVRIARNHAIDRLRAARVRSVISVDAGDPEGAGVRVAEPQTSETPEALMQAGATTGALRAAMATLPDGQRALIEAAFFEGYTHQELAARFELPLGTVKTRIRAGLNSMRARLEQVA